MLVGPQPAPRPVFFPTIGWFFFYFDAQCYWDVFDCLVGSSRELDRRYLRRVYLGSVLSITICTASLASGNHLFARRRGSTFVMVRGQNMFSILRWLLLTNFSSSLMFWSFPPRSQPIGGCSQHEASQILSFRIFEFAFDHQTQSRAK